jgi:predicted homoserine dehydrogenase-like protein
MLFEDLEKLEAEGKPILLGVSGAGWMGSGFVAQVDHVSGMRVAVLADGDPRKALKVVLHHGSVRENVVETDTVTKAEDAIRAGKCVVTGDHTLAAQLESIDVVTDVTPSPATGAETAYAGIKHGKTVVLVNIEADVTVGRILKKLAHDQNVLYTVSSGDEPGCLMELWDFVRSLGYEPIVMGKGKNNPLQPAATPDTVAESAKRAGKNPFQFASYIDGTKTMFEMACAANATGCIPMKRGMVGPEATLENVSRVFALRADGGITTSPFTVDFVQGSAMAGGVFITVRIQDRRICSDLEYLKVGNGGYFTFFRPYHLWFLEAPLSFARAFLYGQATLVPRSEPHAEVMTVAKCTLKPGVMLDEFGGFMFRGVIERADIAERLGALPVGLAPGAKLKNRVWKGKIITWEDVALDEESTLVKLRRMQDGRQNRIIGAVKI